MFTVFSDRHIGGARSSTNMAASFPLHTGLCKFAQNILTNIWSLEKHGDLKLGTLSLQFSTISWLHLTEQFSIYFFFCFMTMKMIHTDKCAFYHCSAGQTHCNKKQNLLLLIILSRTRDRDQFHDCKILYFNIWIKITDPNHVFGEQGLRGGERVVWVCCWFSPCSEGRRWWGVGGGVPSDSPVSSLHKNQHIQIPIRAG